MYREGTARAFWLGAAIFGWGYLLLAYSDLMNMQGHLVTASLVGELFDIMHPNTPSADPVTGKIANPSRGTFWTLGHAFSALALAYLGGLIARGFYATKDKAT